MRRGDKEWDGKVNGFNSNENEIGRSSDGISSGCFGVLGEGNIFIDKLIKVMRVDLDGKIFENEC